MQSFLSCEKPDISTLRWHYEQLFSFFSSRCEEAVQVAVEVVFATVDHSDIRGSKPHNRDPSGAASD